MHSSYTIHCKFRLLLDIYLYKREESPKQPPHQPHLYIIIGSIVEVFTDKRRII